MSQAEGILFALLPYVHMLVDPFCYLPGDRQVVLTFAARPDHHITLIHRLHHLLCLLEVNVVERWVGNDTLNISYKKEKDDHVHNSDQLNLLFVASQISLNEGLTGPLLFLLLLFILFDILGFSIKIIVGVLGKLPLIVLVSEVRCPTGKVHVELLDVDLHDTTMNGHADLKTKNCELL